MNQIPNQQPLSYVPAYPPEDEINLLELWQTLWQNKGWIVAITTLTTVLTVVAVLRMPSTYQVTAYFYPPKAEQVAELQGIDTSVAYAKFIKNLKSRALRRQFFEQQQLFKALTADKPLDDKMPLEVQQNQFFEQQFNELLRVQEDKKEANSASIAYEGGDKERIRDGLNGFVAFVQQYTLDELVNGVKANTQFKINEINDQIAAKRALAQQEVDDRRAQLTEALAVAQQLNIVEERVVWQNQTNSISVNTQNLPDYTRGTKALTAEIASLKNRKSNDPFINGLRDLQEQLKFLANRLNIDKNKIQVVSIEQPAQIPAEPIKPKRPLIVVISFVLGLFFSIMVVLIKNAVTQARQPKAKV